MTIQLWIQRNNTNDDLLTIIQKGYKNIKYLRNLHNIKKLYAVHRKQFKNILENDGIKMGYNSVRTFISNKNIKNPEFTENRYKKFVVFYCIEKISKELYIEKQG